MKKDPKDDVNLPMHMREQGLQMECIHCSVLYPELKGKNCPICHGSGFIFQPARMMDRDLSQRELFEDFTEFFYQLGKKKIEMDAIDAETEKKLARDLRNHAIRLVKKLHIYGFD